MPARSRQSQNNEPPLAEWIVAGIGALIVLGVLGFLVMQALGGR